MSSCSGPIRSGGLSSRNAHTRHARSTGSVGQMKLAADQHCNRSSMCIAHSRQHRVTIANIEECSKENKTIIALLQHVFRSVCTQGEGEEFHVEPTIERIIRQVRHKTYLKIINIHLTQKVDIRDYVFLFGLHRLHEMASQSAELARDVTMHMWREKDDQSQPLTQLLCMHSKSSPHRTPLMGPGGAGGLQGRCSGSTTGVGPAQLDSTGFSNILDALYAAPRTTDDNTFWLAVVEVMCADVRKKNTPCMERYARKCEAYVVNEQAHIVVKLTLQIELRQTPDDFTDYMYGPFPECVQTQVHALRNGRAKC